VWHVAAHSVKQAYYLAAHGIWVKPTSEVGIVEYGNGGNDGNEWLDANGERRGVPNSSTARCTSGPCRRNHGRQGRQTPAGRQGAKVKLLERAVTNEKRAITNDVSDGEPGEARQAL